MSKPLTVGSLVADGFMAVSPDHVRSYLDTRLLSEALDGAARAHSVQAGAQAVAMEPGERYAILRNVAVLPVRGLMTPNSEVLERYLGWSTAHGIEAAANDLAANDDVAAVVTVIDSPGGAVLGMHGAAEALERLAAVKPVHALVHPLAASAAYLMACTATEIAITPGSWVGSIGIMHVSASYLQPGMSGAQVYQITSAHARAKNPDASTDEGRSLIQRHVDDMEADFRDAVARNRSRAAPDVLQRISATDDPADGGGVFWGQDAVDRGLADRVETAPDFWSRVSGLYAPRQQPPRRRSASAQARAAVARAQAGL